MGIYAELEKQPRQWEHETAHIAYAEITPRVRIKRDLSRRMGPQQHAVYQVEMNNGERWIPISAELAHASAAFRRARKIATRHARLERSTA